MLKVKLDYGHVGVGIFLVFEDDDVGRKRAPTKGRAGDGAVRVRRSHGVCVRGAGPAARTLSSALLWRLSAWTKT